MQKSRTDTYITADKTDGMFFTLYVTGKSMLNLFTPTVKIRKVFYTVTPGECEYTDTEK